MSGGVDDRTLISVWESDCQSIVTTLSTILLTSIFPPTSDIQVRNALFKYVVNNCVCIIKDIVEKHICMEYDRYQDYSEKICLPTFMIESKLSKYL